MKVIAGNDFIIRPTSPSDMALLLRWHADPEVYGFWERRPLTEQEIQEKYLGARLPDVRCFIIEAPPGDPVGFIEDSDLDEPGEVGIDMFLIPRARGAGLGPRVARHLAQHVLDTTAAERVTVDPLVANERAVAAWRKAGFHEVARIDEGDHGEPALLMAFELSDTFHHPARHW